ncbi:MAG: hypothetical protein AAB874_01555 [Patescibacteria group bacterium]
MNQSENEVILEKEWSFWRIGMMVSVLVGIGIGMIAFFTFRDGSGRASVPVVKPTPFSTLIVVPSPRTELVTPYARLVSERLYHISDKILVDIYAATGNQEVVELTLILTYDPQVLEVNADNIKNAGVFKTINADTKEPGKLILTLFITPTVGHKPIVLHQETKLATVQFKPLVAQQGRVEVNLEYSKGNSQFTTLTPFSSDRPEKPINLLESVEGAVFTIE